MDIAKLLRSPEPISSRLSLELETNGFITLTHERSHTFQNDSIPTHIAQLTSELQTGLREVWQNRHGSPYKYVKVLLTHWAADDLGVVKEVDMLQHVFSDFFRYDVSTYVIPDHQPDRALKLRVIEFLEDDGQDTLLIFYYAGHAFLNPSRQDAPVWAANRTNESSTLPSGGLQSLLEEASCDVLLLYDSCHSADTAVTPARSSSRGITEVIAACGFEAIAPEVGEHSFTNALAHVLAMSSEGLPLFVSELHSRLLARLRSWVPSPLKDSQGRFIKNDRGSLLMEPQRRRTPIHCILSPQRSQRRIILVPLSHSQNHAPTSVQVGQISTLNPQAKSRTVGLALSRPSTTNLWSRYRRLPNPEFVMTVTLSDEAANGRQKPDKNAWLEWLRNAPPEVMNIEIGLKENCPDTQPGKGTDENLGSFQIHAAEHDRENQSDEYSAYESWNNNNPWALTSGSQDHFSRQSMAPGFSFFDHREQNHGSTDQESFVPAGASVIVVSPSTKEWVSGLRNDLKPNSNTISGSQESRRPHLPTSHRRVPWSQTEDDYLVQLVHTQKALNWVRIAQFMGSRSPKQCRERYHQNLQPSLNHKPVSPEEGLQIEYLVSEMGKRSAEIARRLRGRSDKAMKNWWNESMNRRRQLARRRNISAPRVTSGVI